jgi:hypothetical protein
MALSLLSDLPVEVNRILCPGKLAGGDGRLPRAADLAEAFFDIVFRRLVIGMPKVVSPASLTAATMAATLLAFEDTLFRRVTLWLVIREPEDTECEWFREWDLGREPEYVDIDRRCWLRGLEECWISWKFVCDQQRSKNISQSGTEVRPTLEEAMFMGYFDEDGPQSSKLWEATIWGPRKWSTAMWV